MRTTSARTNVQLIPEPPVSKFLFANTTTSFFWLLVRLYVGWQWIEAGWEKVNNPMWVGPTAGKAISGFLMGALAKVGGEHPSVQGWYGAFIKEFVLPNAFVFSHMVAFGELLVGVALILGIFTGIAAFFGSLMNMNYLLAGTISINPILFFLQLFLILAWRVAGWWGLDRYVLPMLGTPWFPGDLFKKK
jgi:thiosulfate dehydrogenase [quinone] large subunit